MKRTQRVCKQCEKLFYGDPDCLLCPECAKKARASSVMRDRACIDCEGKKVSGLQARGSSGSHETMQTERSDASDRECGHLPDMRTRIYSRIWPSEILLGGLSADRCAGMAEGKKKRV